jgi:ABC-type dipeptide/oligopeptide/nickel transport system permease component
MATQTPAKKNPHTAEPPPPAPKRGLVVLRYFSSHLVRVVALGVGGTALAWLAIWYKATTESADAGGFFHWINADVLQRWSVNAGDLTNALSGLVHTMLLVAIAILISGALSVLVGWHTSRRPHARYWGILETVMNFFGGIPVFFLCFLLRDYRFEMVNDWGIGWLLPVAAVLILAWGEGNASLWTRVFRRQFQRLRKSPHIQAALGRGLPIGQRVRRDSTAIAVESLGSRAVILLGAAAIVEWMLDLDSGIGYAIVDQFQTMSSGVQYSTWAAQVFALVWAVALLRGVDSVVRDWSRRFATD